jgi:MtN3 and saliva related transmembrane protein
MADSLGLADFIGLVAGALTTIAFIPQLLKIYASKSGKDVSARMFVIFSLGVALWLAYGILIGSLPVIIANTVTLALSLAIMGLKVRYARRDRARQR